jgi:hypothetical protein
VKIADQALDCVAFIGIKQGSKFVPRATGFFIQCLEHNHAFLHLVTAEHVLSRMLSKGHEIWLRVNVFGDKGAAVIPIEEPTKAFRFHPNNASDPADVAVCPFSPVLKDEKTGESVHLALRALMLTEGARACSG